MLAVGSAVLGVYAISAGFVGWIRRAVGIPARTAVGLAGERLTDGLVGQWVQPYWLWLNARDAGGRLDVEVEEGRVVLTAVLPG